MTTQTKTAAVASAQPAQQRTKRRRGFAAMEPALQRAIASRGGQMAHALRTAHRWTSEEAAAAGRKGASARRARRIAQAWSQVG